MSGASTAADIAKITVIGRAEEGQVYFVDMASFPVADNRGWKLPPVPHHKDHIFIRQLFTPATLFAPNKKVGGVPGTWGRWLSESFALDRINSISIEKSCILRINVPKLPSLSYVVGVRINSCASKLPQIRPSSNRMIKIKRINPMTPLG